MDRKAVRLSEVREAAEAHEGVCLTEGEADTRVLYAEFVCCKGHGWRALASKVVAGGWCSKCVPAKKKHTIEEMRRIARERGGQCLSEEYVNIETKLEWQCGQGHGWWTNPHTILKGAWCPTCKHEKMKNTIEDMVRLAERRGGKCLSTHYVNNATPLWWECKEGHSWKNQPANITMGQWCPEQWVLVPAMCRESTSDHPRDETNCGQARRPLPFRSLH